MAVPLRSSDEFSLNRNNPAIMNAARATPSENIDSEAMIKVVKLLNQNRENTFDALLTTLFIGLTLEIQDHQNNDKDFDFFYFNENRIKKIKHILAKKINHLKQKLDNLDSIKPSINSESMLFYKSIDEDNFIYIQKYIDQHLSENVDQHTYADINKDIFILYKGLRSDEVTKLRKKINIELENKGFSKSNQTSKNIQKIQDIIIKTMVGEPSLSWWRLPFLPFYAPIKVCGYIIKMLKYLIRESILSMFVVWSWVRPPKHPYSSVRQQADDRKYIGPALIALRSKEETLRIALNEHRYLILLLFSDLIDDMLKCNVYSLKES